MKKICVITDNPYIYQKFKTIILEKNYGKFFFYCSKQSDLMDEMEIINLSECKENFFTQYDIFLSLHSKQIFPRTLVKNHRCINVHPGLNPYNRGIYPHVFSIVNGLPAGVSIHEMDENIDHGGIIFQKVIAIYSWDTSTDVYNRILDTEEELLRAHLKELISGEYTLQKPSHEGNVNYKKDFDKMCHLDLDSQGTLREHLDLLRALSHSGYKNAYYVEDGRKIFVDIGFKQGGGGIKKG